MIYGPLSGPFAGTQDIRCRDCKHWKRDPADPLDADFVAGRCRRVGQYDADKDRANQALPHTRTPDAEWHRASSYLVTQPEFGCVLAEKKP